MVREELNELQWITPIDNLASVMENGILSHERAEHLSHLSVADEEVQDRRQKVRIPNGLRLHQYANVYINARNAMLYRLQNHHENLCVVRVLTDILDIQNVVVSDQNAAADYVRFFRPDEGLRQIDSEYVFAEYWLHANDPLETLRHKKAMCAEVLVPHFIPPAYLAGAWVCSEVVLGRVRGIAPGLPVQVNKRLFFK